MFENMVRAFIAQLILGGAVAALVMGGMGYFIVAAINGSGI